MGFIILSIYKVDLQFANHELQIKKMEFEAFCYILTSELEIKC